MLDEERRCSHPEEEGLSCRMKVAEKEKRRYKREISRERICASVSFYFFLSLSVYIFLLPTNYLRSMSAWYRWDKRTVALSRSERSRIKTDRCKAGLCVGSVDFLIPHPSVSVVFFLVLYMCACTSAWFYAALHLHLGCFFLSLFVFLIFLRALLPSICFVWGVLFTRSA